MNNLYNTLLELLMFCRSINIDKNSLITIKPNITINQSLEQFCIENEILDPYIKTFCDFPIKEYEDKFTIGE